MPLANGSRTLEFALFTIGPEVQRLLTRHVLSEHTGMVQDTLAGSHDLMDYANHAMAQ